MMAYNAKLRAALVAEVEARTTMELQLVQQEVIHAQVREVTMVPWEHVGRAVCALC